MDAIDAIAMSMLSVASILGVVGTVVGLRRNWQASIDDERQTREAPPTLPPLHAEDLHVGRS